jgi:galactokinase
MPDIAIADAPGRVNLIGEHTDYHEGYVLPAVIPLRTRVRLRRRAGGRVHASSNAVRNGAGEYVLGQESRGRGWLDYVQGVTDVLRRSGFSPGDIDGFEADFESTIPLGAGVSSSAALEVSLLRGLRQLFGFTFDDVALATMAQRVETEFVGAPVGIMDQMASSVGREGEALFLDTRTLAIERVPMPASIELAVIDSGISHAHAGGEYATRRRESFEAAALLGVDRLRDVRLRDGDAAAWSRLDALPPVLARRARHIITENDRVLAAVAALRAADADRLGALFAASHASMRDDFETSTPEIDTLVAAAQRHPDVIGARLTGGGFGGAVVLLTRARCAEAAARAVCDSYRQQTGRDGAVLVPVGA